MPLEVGAMASSNDVSIRDNTAKVKDPSSSLQPAATTTNQPYLKTGTGGHVKWEGF